MAPHSFVIAGLSLDILGVILLWLFTVGRGPMLVLANDDEVEIGLGSSKHRRRNKFLEHTGALCVVVGFGLQMFGVWLDATVIGPQSTTTDASITAPSEMSDYLEHTDSTAFVLPLGDGYVVAVGRPEALTEILSTNDTLQP